MAQFNKDEISTLVGSEGENIQLPQLNEVKELVSKAEQGEHMAVIQIFKYYRFGTVKRAEEDFAVVNIIMDAMSNLFVK